MRYDIEQSFACDYHGRTVCYHNTQAHRGAIKSKRRKYNEDHSTTSKSSTYRVSLCDFQLQFYKGWPSLLISKLLSNFQDNMSRRFLGAFKIGTQFSETMSRRWNSVSCLFQTLGESQDTPESAIFCIGKLYAFFVTPPCEHPQLGDEPYAISHGLSPQLFCAPVCSKPSFTLSTWQLHAYRTCRILMFRFRNLAGCKDLRCQVFHRYCWSKVQHTLIAGNSKEKFDSLRKCRPRIETPEIQWICGCCLHVISHETLEDAQKTVSA